MTKQFDAKRYWVKPGKTVKLQDWNPAERRLSSGDKTLDAQTLAALNEQLDKLQDLLYAGHQHKLIFYTLRPFLKVTPRGYWVCGERGSKRSVTPCAE